MSAPQGDKIYDEGQMEDIQRKYDLIIVDSVNLAYRTFKQKGETPLQLSKKSIYRDSVCKFIDTVTELEDKYLKREGQVYFLFDNYFSKADLRTTYMFADRRKIEESYKATRKKNTREFYNSINFLRYYYLIGPSRYHTLRVDGLEADDLVEPLMRKLGVKGSEIKALMVTTDEDWARYLLPNVDWIPDFSQGPENIRGFEDRKGYYPTKKGVILYKSIFGDPSDNIKSLVPFNDSTLKAFLEILGMIDNQSSLEMLILESRDETLRETNPILKVISQNEKAFISNIQLVSPIPCGMDIINQSLTSGRNDSTLYHTVRGAIGLDVSKEFVFGNIKRSKA